MMKPFASILATWLLASLPLLAAEDDSGEGTAAEPEQPAAVTGTEAPDPDSGLTPPPSEDPASEDFVPSIRITEDLPVAFPADI
jgi:hypothetical protein